MTNVLHYSLHHQRIPLVILIGGAGSVGKSTLATQLAERLNLTNTLKTDLICEMTRSLLG
jgi:2-phosphoglycerate kinase